MPAYIPLLKPGIIFLCSVLSFSVLVEGQATNPRKKTDSLFKAPQKRFGRAVIELGLGEVVPLFIDGYFSQQGWANISFKSIGHNLRPSTWTWDYDEFQTNEIGHPFHGSIFFNVFRSNGYSFWPSAPTTFAGSYLWETQAPSINDFITTGLVYPDVNGQKLVKEVNSLPYTQQ